MRIFNFGKNLVKWVEILFKEFQLCTINNGLASNYMTPTRGLFQGNPVSPYGFILVIELLAVTLQSNTKIQGAKVGPHTNLLSLFADDMSIFLSNKQSAWQELQNVLDKFRWITGLKVNYDKSVIYRMGLARKTNAKFYSAKKLIWTNDPINVLGYIIAETDDEMLELNMRPMLEKARSVASLWLARNLTLLGKVLVFNTLIASIFEYRLKVLPDITEKYLKIFNEIMLDFIWEGKKPKIKQHILQGNKNQGGLGLINIIIKQKALKAQWVFDLEKDPLTEYMAYDFIGNKIGRDLWNIKLR